MAAVLALLAVLFLVTFAYFLHRHDSKVLKKIEKIPILPLLPVIGNAHLFEPNNRDFLKQILGYCVQFGDIGIFAIKIGFEPLVALFHAETVEVLFSSKKHITKGFVYKFLEPWLRTGLLTSAGEKWKFRRKLLTPTFHFKILNDFLGVFNEQSEIMVKNLQGKVGKEKFDLFPFITHCALDIICETAMGKNINAQVNDDSEYVTAVYGISELIQKRQKAPWLHPDFIYYSLPAGRQFTKYLKVLHNFTEKVILERSEEIDRQLLESSAKIVSLHQLVEDDGNFGQKKRLAFLDMLLYASKGQATLSFLDIREEVDTFMFEGHDTTAAAANWACHLIGANPDVQQKLQDEIDSIFGGSDRQATMEDLHEMKYLECVIKETLRLFPSVPLFARTMTEDAVVNGYKISKGVCAVVVTSALHRDPRYFPDPEVFDPDRFLPENTAGRHPYAYVPFSAGLRNCIGKKFAMNEEKVLLSSIVRNFKITSHQTREELHPTGEVILRPENGIIVTLESRS